MPKNSTYKQTHAFVIGKKDKTRTFRQVFLVTKEFSFLRVCAFGASHSARMSSVTSPFVLINAYLEEQKYGLTMIDAQLIKDYSQINMNLDYFEMVYEWVKLIIKTSGAGQDDRLFAMLEKLFGGIEADTPPIILNTFFYVNFLHILGTLPEKIADIDTIIFLKKSPQHCSLEELDWNKVMLLVKSRLLLS